MEAACVLVSLDLLERDAKAARILNPEIGFPSRSSPQLLQRKPTLLVA